MATSSPLYQVTIAPNPAHAGETVTAYVFTDGECLPPATSVSITTQAVTLRLDFTDACEGGGRFKNRAYDLGALPAGAYAFQINACTDNPPPLLSACSIVYSAPLAVAASVITVPGNYVVALGLLCLSLFVVAMKRLRKLVAWSRASRQRPFN